MAFKVTPLSDNERAASGFTHKAVISYANGDFTAAALTQTYTLQTLASGQLIKSAALRVVTPIAGGAIATAVATVGKTGTVNQYVTSTDVFTGTVVALKGGDGAGLAAAGGEGFSGASTLTCIVTTTTGNVSVATAGELHVWFSLLDMTKF